MKKGIYLLLLILTLQSISSSASDIIDPVKQDQLDEYQWIMDNPKGKLKIRFVRIEDKSDTTNKPKTFFAKLKNVFNALLDISDNPPFKIEVVREKEKKN